MSAHFEKVELGTATAFVAEHDGASFLVTNWHVASGRNPTTGAPMHDSGALPTDLWVLHHHKVAEGFEWCAYPVPLHDEQGAPLWLEHPVHGRKVDVVAIPLEIADNIRTFAYTPSQPGDDIAIGASDALSIIGFPFGMTGGGAFGIWVQGAVATEPDVDFEDLPLFLVDSRTRSGQSGSPVLAWRPDSYRTSNGDQYMMPGQRLVGVYSGRVNEQSDLGFVWKIDALVEILQAHKLGDGGMAPPT